MNLLRALIASLLLAALLQSCGSAGLSAPAEPEAPAGVTTLRPMDEISSSGQSVRARDGHTLLLVGFEVPGCQGTTTFFFGVGPDGYIVDKDFSEMVLRDVFCNEIEALSLVDAAGSAYPPLGFVDGKQVIFEAPLSAENLVVRMNADILLPLIGDPDLGKVEPTITVPYCDEAIAAGRAGDGSYLCMSSETGDYVGDGRDWLFTAGDSEFGLIDPRTMNFFINKGEWSLEFLPASHTPGKPGLYEDAVRGTQALQESRNGLDVNGDGRGCNALTGKFEILDMRWRADNTLTRLYVNFEQHCEGEDPALYGYLRFDLPPEE